LDLPFAECFRVSDGKIAEHNSMFDQMKLLGQLGALPQA
jgi:predicted ester cyclase